MKRLRLVLAGMLVSALGDGMSLVAVAWLALQIAPDGQEGVWTGISVAAYALPAPIGAALLARWMRRLPAARLVTADATLRAVALGAAGALAITGRLDPVAYACLLALSSLLHAWGTAGAYTLVAEHFPAEKRLAGNALVSAFAQVSIVVGPAVAGGLAALAGPGWVIAADAATWAVLALTAWTVPTRPVGEAEAGGWRTIRDRPALLGLIAVTCVFFFLYGPVEVALPVLVAGDLHGSAGLLGLYWTVFGIGATVGAASAALLRRLPPWTVVVVIIIGWGAALLPVGLSAAIVPGLIGMAAGGLIYGPFTAITTGLFQTATPPEALSRVLATRAAIQTPSASLGTLLGGPLVTLAGARPTLVLSALLTIGLGVAAGAGRRS
ncbi:MFS transporter [Actinoplanes sp. CA-030573]|uniref:MFS transporter n=1 Tax=Actinoplanes sp. CA-030573 TaxID=3239898 RepID=UPI003D8F88A2